MGLVIPTLSSPLVCLILRMYRTPVGETGHAIPFWDFYAAILNNPVQLPTFISLCTISNLIVFAILLQKQKDWIARGMIFSTICHAIVYFILKLN